MGAEVRLAAAAVLLVALLGACGGGGDGDAAVVGTTPPTSEAGAATTTTPDPAATSEPAPTTEPPGTTAPPPSTAPATAPELTWSANQVDVRLGEAFPRAPVQERAAGGVPCSWAATQPMDGALTIRLVVPDPIVPAAVGVTIFSTPAQARAGLQAVTDALSSCAGTYQAVGGAECGDIDVLQATGALDYAQTCSVTLGGASTPPLRYREHAVVVDNLLLSTSQLEERFDETLPQRVQDAFSRAR